MTREQFRNGTGEFPHGNKECSTCSKTIMLEAFECPFCGEEFDPDEVARQVKEYRSYRDGLGEFPHRNKECSTCSKTIRVEAFECPFCEEEFDPDQVARQVKEYRDKLKEYKSE